MTVPMTNTITIAITVSRVTMDTMAMTTTAAPMVIASETLQCKGICGDGTRAYDEACGIYVIHPGLGLGESEYFRHGPCRVFGLHQCLLFWMVLLKHTGINDHLIDLVDNKQPPYDLSSHPPTLQYCPSARRAVTFHYMSIIKVSITWP